MRRSDLNDLTAFVAVADHLSFRAAASQLGVTPSALSHRMRQLEQRVGVRLLHRTTRSVSPTDAGRRLLDELRPAIEQIQDAMKGLKQDRDGPTGKLKIHAPSLAAMMVITPIWQAFLAKYPKIQLEIGGQMENLDIVARGFDAGIAVREYVALDMTTVRVTPQLKTAVVASPGYFAQHPAPQTPDDLKQHNCIQLRLPISGTVLNWTFNKKRASRSLLYKTDVVPVSGNLVVSDVDLAIRAAVDGLGIVYTLQSSVDFFIRSGHLVQILEDWCPVFEGLYLYYPGNRQIPASLRAFINMIRTARSKPGPQCPGIPFLEQTKSA